MALAKVGNGVMIGMLIGGEHPKGNPIVGGLFDLSRTRPAYSVRIEQQADHHPGIERRLAALVVIVATADRTKIQLADNIYDKIDQMILRQLLFHIRGQQEQLVRVIQLKASLILHSQMMTPQVKIEIVAPTVR